MYRFRERLNYIYFSIYIFLVPISVITQVIPNKVSISINILMGIHCFFYLLYENKIKINRLENKFIFLPLVVGVFVASLTFIFSYNNLYYQKFFLEKYTGRVFNIILYIFIYNASIITIEKMNSIKEKKIILNYLTGIFVFFIIIAFWQILNVRYGIWMPELDTRSHLHSTGSIKGFRVTGLANEPSYLAPFMIDFILLSLLYSNYIWILGAIVLYYSFSAGGYLNLLILIVISLKLAMLKKLKKEKIIIILIVFFLSILLLFYNSDLIIEKLQPFLLRFEDNGLFSLNNSIRSFMIFMPFLYLFETNIFNIFFGMGAGSFKYLSLTKVFIDGRELHSTSNNLYSDFFYEGGLFLFSSILFFFIWKIKFRYKAYKIDSNRRNLIKLLLLIHLLVSSMYRADFFTSRFWIILLILNLKLLDEKGEKR